MAAADGGGAAGLEGTVKALKEKADEAEARLAKVEAILINKDGLSTGNEEISSAVKDLQSKLDAVNADYLAEKEKNKKLTMENGKLHYRISHLIRAVKETDST